jgi:hypothetical protein
LTTGAIMANKSTEPPTVPEQASPATAVGPAPVEDPAPANVDPAPATDAEAAPIVAVDPAVRIRENDFVSIFTDTSDR